MTENSEIQIIPGQKLRGYEILERIGTGGQGAVFRAFQPGIEREVAIKAILPQVAQNEVFAARFAAEAHLIARLEHPHIVPLYDYWNDESGAYLVMRYLRGGSLRDMLRKQGGLSLSTVVHYLNQITDALAVAHQSQVIHRDLKPDNILLDEHENAYLSDFGIAKNLLGQEYQSDAGMLVGTPAYLAPEQIQGHTVTPQSDIYNLGLMLHELLAGQHPFNGLTAGQLILHHVNEPLPTITADHTRLPPGLQSIINRATAKQPADRYPDVQSFKIALQTAAMPIQTTDVVTVVQPAAEAPAPEPLTVTELIDLLPAADAQRKREIISKLGQLGDVTALPVLTDLLRDTTAGVHDRRMAAQALGQLGDSRACMGLITVLSEPPKPDKRRLPRLRKLRKQLISLRGESSTQLAQRQQIDRQIAEVDSTIIHNGDTIHLLKLAAVTALGQIGYVLALKPLESIVNSGADASLVAAAEVALEQVRDKSDLTVASEPEPEIETEPAFEYAELLTCSRCAVTSETSPVVRCQNCRLSVCEDHWVTEVDLYFCSQSCLDSFANKPGNWEYWV